MDYLNNQQSIAGHDNKVTEFKNPQKIALQVTIALGASIIMIIIIAINTFLMFLSNKPHHGGSGLIGGLAVVPVMCIAVAIYLLKSPVRVLLDERGLIIEWLIRRRTFSWNEIAEIQLKKEEGISSAWIGMFTGKKDAPKESLLLLNRNGRKLAAIPASIKPFDVLVREIHSRTTTARGTSTFDVDKQTSQEMSASRKKQKLLLVLGIPIMLLGITVGIATFIDEHRKNLLEKDGQIIEAEVVKHYIYNITPRMEYAFTAPDGKKYSKNVMVEREYWEAAGDSNTVSVKYLPANPGNNKLASGQVEDSDMPLPLTIVVSVMVAGFGFLCMSMYLFKIADIKYVNGRFKIIRENQVELSPTATVLLGAAGGAYKVPVPQQQIPEYSPVAAAAIPSETLSHAAHRKLPGGLKAIGILNIVFGAIGAIWNLGRILIAFLLASNLVSPPENVELEINLRLVLIDCGIAGLAAVLLAISGIAILMFLNWGRILAIIASLVKLLLVAIEIIEAMLRSIETYSSEDKFITYIVKMFYVFFMILVMVYPVIVIVLLRRKTTRELFKR